MRRSHKFYFFQILILAVQVQVASSQDINKADSICWRSGYKLQWSDFQGVPVDGLPWKAVCATEITATGFWYGKCPNYVVNIYFFPSRSWTKDTTSVALLAHERLHFDIRELFARKIRWTVDALRNSCETRVSVYDNAIQSILTQCKEWTTLYDEQTGHGLRGSNQAEWAAEGNKQLVLFAKYESKCSAL